MKIRITVVSVVLGFIVACTGEATVAGDRAQGGCPDDETCSDLAPSGLQFRGQVLYDEGLDRLGPILVGGQFDLSFNRHDADLSYFEVDLDAHLDQAGTYRDPAGVILWGLTPGSSSVRVVDETGALLDRLTIDVVALEDVQLSNVVEPERTTLYAGCEEMIGVSLVAGSGKLRAFDQNITITAPGGSLIPDPWVWDCFRYQVPADATTVTFEVEAAGELWPVEFEVVPLEEGQDCPPIGD